MTHATALRRAEYARMRWRNGAGWTTELAVRPAGATLDTGFDWRLSVAEVDADGDFSPFPGYARTIMLLEGNGMELALDDAARTTATLNVRGQPFDFPGATAVRCRLLDGPSRDFNVMVREGRVHARTTFRPLVGPMVFFAEPGVTWAIHVASGSAQVQGGGVALETGDTLLLEPDGTSGGQTVISGGGEVVLVRFEAAPAGP